MSGPGPRTSRGAAPGDRPRRHQDRRGGARRRWPRLRRAPRAGPARRLRRHRRSRGRDGGRARAGGGPQPAASASACPGRWSPASGLVQNANSTWLNGRPFQRDLEARLGRPGPARQRCQLLCAVGGRRRRRRRRPLGVRRDPRHGLRRRARLRRRAHRRPARHRRRVGPQPPALGGAPTSTRAPSAGAGAWAASRPGCPGPASPPITRGRRGAALSAEEIAARAAAGDAAAQATLDRHAGRLARGLAHVVNIFDPDVIVLGGGLSKLAHLYAVLPDLMAPYVLRRAGRTWSSSRPCGATPAACAAPRGYGAEARLRPVSAGGPVARAAGRSRPAATSSRTCSARGS